MNSRERIRCLLDGKPTDRIPNGLGGCETAGLHNIAYHKLKKILGVGDPANRLCTFMSNAVFEPSVLRAMGGDIILLGSRMCPSAFWGPDAGSQWKPLHIWGMDIEVANDWRFRQDTDGTWWWNDGLRCPPGGIYFDAHGGGQFGDMLSTGDAPSPDDYNPPHELPEQLLTRLRDEARLLYETTDFSIACGEMIDDLQLQPGGTVAWWMRMVEEPQACHEFLAKAVDASLAQLRQLDQAIGPYCDILGIAHDLGDLRGVTMGPDLWREIYLPHYKRLFTEWHKITRMKVNLHTCGAISDILPDLIDCGVDLYNPVQVSAHGMEPERLKALSGGRLIFYGGAYDAVQCAGLSEEAVYEQVKSNIRALNQGGGLLFAGVHNLPGDTPEPHLSAMLRALRDAQVPGAGC